VETRAYLQGAFAKFYRENPELIQPPPSMERREFGFQLFRGRVMVRHKRFKTPGELREFMARVGPSDAYRSAAYYERPDAEMAEKGWLGADLAFDIDADHIETPCKEEHDVWRCVKCGRVGRGPAPERCPKCGCEKFKVSTWPCEVCLKSAKEELQYFSGHRGYHLMLEEETIRTLNQDERKEIADYLMAVGIDPALHGFEVGGSGHIRLDAPGWRGRIARGVYQVLLSDEELRKAGVRGGALQRGREALLRGLEEGVVRLPRGVGRGTWSRVALQGARMQSVRLDPVVTIDVHRLMRLEGSLHGKTGLRKVEVPISRLEVFDPLREAVAFRRGEVAVRIRRRHPPPLQGVRRGGLRVEYDTVYEAWLREKKAEELQPIPKDFYKQLAEYIHTLREKVAELGGETVEGEIAEEELKNVYEMARSLVKLRLRKILRRAMRGETINAESITPEESKFLEGAKHLSEIYHNILGMVSGRLETGALKEAERGVEEKPKKILVRFLRDTPRERQSPYRAGCSRGGEGG